MEMIEVAEHGNLSVWKSLKSKTKQAKNVLRGVFCCLKKCYNIFMKFKKILLVLVIFVVVAVAIISFLSTVHYESTIVLGGKTFYIDVADNSFTSAKGLSGRESMAKDEGMIFVFDKLGKHGFWMKDMFFSIDMIWMDQNYVITHIEKSVSPDTYPKVFYPESLSLYVLEISAGQSDLLGIKVGDRANFIRKNSI